MFGFWPFSYQQPKYKSAEDRLREQLAAVEAVNARLRDENDKLKAEVQELTIYKQGMIETLEDYCNQINSLTTEKSSLLMELDKRDEQIKELQKALASRISECDSLNASLYKFNQENADLTSKVRELKSENSQRGVEYKLIHDELAEKNLQLREYKDKFDQFLAWNRERIGMNQR